MYRRVLRQMRERVRTRQYVMTIHAEEEMDNDGLTIFDVERAILTGEITERQEDQQSGEWKYVLVGQSVHAERVAIVAKLSMTSKLIIITVFVEE